MSINISRLRKDDKGKEVPVTHLLDFIELPCSHTGLNMANCIADVLKEYGIEDKVSRSFGVMKKIETYIFRS